MIRKFKLLIGFSQVGNELTIGGRRKIGVGIEFFEFLQHHHQSRVVLADKLFEQLHVLSDPRLAVMDYQTLAAASDKHTDYQKPMTGTVTAVATAALSLPPSLLSQRLKACQRFNQQP